MVAVNIGDPINTDKEENSPFIHFDNRTLYFCSDGHTGMGGRDLYFTKLDSSGKWMAPVNLGYPINTCADEFGLIVNTKGDTAYFSSDKEGGKGKLDLYCFELNKENRPMPVTYVKGIVFNNETKEKIEARFELINLKTGKIVYTSFSDPVKGDFLVTLPSENDYALNVSKEGYLFYSDNFSLKGNWSIIEPFIKNIPLQPIKVGESVVLRNIFFETAKYDLKTESVIELDKLVAFLKTNDKLKIEISGHTDNIGTKEYNQILSENRAKSVYNYLIEIGIDKARLTFKGFGDTKPIDTNDTDAGRSNNRRTEFKIIGQ
jgi:outer membrane protein OmpA-like peptidoglycan-associated protein